MQGSCESEHGVFASSDGFNFFLDDELDLGLTALRLNVLTASTGVSIGKASFLDNDSCDS